MADKALLHRAAQRLQHAERLEHGNIRRTVWLKQCLAAAREAALLSAGFAEESQRLRDAALRLLGAAAVESTAPLPIAAVNVSTAAREAALLSAGSTEEQHLGDAALRQVGAAVDAESTALPTPAVQVITREPYGRCLVATRAIEAGEFVLRERPLLQTAAAGRTNNRTERCLRAFCGAGVEVQRQILNDMFIEESDLSEYMRGSLEEVEQHVQAAWASPHSLATLRKVMLAFNLNSHVCEDRSCALFAMGSKFAHVCDANTVYTPSGGWGQHMAVRSIEAGELVTTNYLGGDTGLPRPLRQQVLLSQKLFRCSCDRCSATADLTRAVPCPGCHPRYVLELLHHPPSCRGAHPTHYSLLPTSYSLLPTPPHSLLLPTPYSAPIPTPPHSPLLPTPRSPLPTPHSSPVPNPYSLLPTPPHSLLPTPHSPLPTPPHSLLPTPYSLLPTPYSLLPTRVRDRAAAPPPVLCRGLPTVGDFLLSGTSYCRGFLIDHL